MSSALNHRRRSRRSYEKRVATMNTLQRNTAVKEHQPSFRDIFMMILRKKRQSPFKRMKSDSSR